MPHELDKLKTASEELDYWRQIVEDNGKTIDGLININKGLNALIRLADDLMENEYLEYAHELLLTIKDLQTTMNTILLVQEAQPRLTTGRMEMIKRDLGIED